MTLPLGHHSRQLGGRSGIPTTKKTMVAKTITPTTTPTARADRSLMTHAPTIRPHARREQLSTSTSERNPDDSTSCSCCIDRAQLHDVTPTGDLSAHRATMHELAWLPTQRDCITPAVAVRSKRT